MKKIMMLTLLVLILAGCSVNAVEETKILENNEPVVEDVQDEKSDRIVRDGPVFVDFDPEYNDERYFEESKNVVIARVEKILGCDNYSKINDSYMFAYTKAAINIIENIKGDLKTGDTINIYKMGGTISYANQFKALNKDQQEKRLSFIEEDLPDEDVHEYIYGDIVLEEGKLYLFYLVDDDIYEGNEDEYLVNGFYFGSKEVNLEERTVLDNESNEWEALQY